MSKIAVYNAYWSLQKIWAQGEHFDGTILLRKRHALEKKVARIKLAETNPVIFHISKNHCLYRLCSLIQTYAVNLFQNNTVSDTVWKLSVIGNYLVRIFSHLDWVWRNFPYLSAFCPNARNNGGVVLVVLLLTLNIFYIFVLVFLLLTLSR